MNSVMSYSEQDTMKAALNFGKKISPGSIIGLNGELGSGKTRFVKGFVQAFGIEPEVVTSPTFSIINEYHGSVPVYHLDCYRLKNEWEALEIGAEEYFYGGGVSIIEWPRHILSLLPAEVKWVHIETINKHSRKITFSDQMQN